MCYFSCKRFILLAPKNLPNAKPSTQPSFQIASYLKHQGWISMYSCTPTKLNHQFRSTIGKDLSTSFKPLAGPNPPPHPSHFLDLAQGSGDLRFFLKTKTKWWRKGNVLPCWCYPSSYKHGSETWVPPTVVDLDLFKYSHFPFLWLWEKESWNCVDNLFAGDVEQFWDCFFWFLGVSKARRLLRES